MSNVMNNVDVNLVKIARDLQVKRENWKAKLDAVEMPKVGAIDFPYANMEQAVADDFKLLFGGRDEAFRLLVKGYKTRAWRKAAEKNRDRRDKIAEVDIKRPAAAKK